MQMEIGGEVHSFFDPTPRQISQLICSFPRAIGQIGIKEIFPGQTEQLYVINGWTPKSRIERTAGMSGTVVSQIIRAELGSVGAIVSPERRGLRIWQLQR